MVGGMTRPTLRAASAWSMRAKIDRPASPNQLFQPEQRRREGVSAEVLDEGCLPSPGGVGLHGHALIVHHGFVSKLQPA